MEWGTGISANISTGGTAILLVLGAPIVLLASWARFGISGCAVTAMQMGGAGVTTAFLVGLPSLILDQASGARLSVKASHKNLL